ncbi:MAG: TIGR03960 family B12-binding radical SAM protein [Thermodesulfobacteriota bacterium]
MAGRRRKIKQAERRETGAVRKHWAGRIRVALVYPNTYYVGMSNLGFQTVYHLINGMDQLVCERVFLPDRSRSSVEARPVSVESERPLTDFDVVAFSVSFESDYPHILTILDVSGIPLTAEDRASSHPLVLAGGVACFLNPEPIAPFIDGFLIGEAEEILSPFFNRFDPETDRTRMLANLARTVEGVYVPRFYDVEYGGDGTIHSFAPNREVPERVRRVYLKDLSESPTCSALMTSDTTFDRTYLIEVARGCSHGCRFCSAGYIYRPPRFRTPEVVAACMADGARSASRIGLVGAAVSDFPGIGDLCARYFGEAVRISFSSLRADAISPELLDTLKHSGVKTATIAPDAGSERMRQVINKGITEADILSAAETLVGEGIPNLKLYFMVGLPTETDADVTGIIDLCKRIKHRFLKSSRTRGRIGEITVSLNSFVPKPMTPFQWAAMNEVFTLKRKEKKIKEGLRRVANLRLHHDVPKHAYLQALLSRGDRRVAPLLTAAHAHGGNWAHTFKESPINPDFFVSRERSADEIFPWDFIDHRVDKGFLRREYERALKGKPSPPCPLTDTCSLCGACAEATVDADPGSV